MTLVYYFPAEMAVVQDLWCNCYRKDDWALAAEWRLRGTDCASIVMRWRHGQVEVNGPAGVSGVQITDNGSVTHCWRCVLEADAADWEDVGDGSHGFAATQGFAAEWTRHCSPCRKSWRRGEDESAWRPVRYDLVAHDA